MIKKIFSRNFSLHEQAYFASRLSFLVGAEISLVDALFMLRAQSQKIKERKMLDYLSADISKGNFLSTSLEKINPKFNSLAVQIIKTGEMTGTLGTNLQYVSDELKKRQLLLQKIIGALFYPLCIGVVTIGITGMITLYILPKITPIFSSLNAVLPMSTRILLFTHAVIMKYGIFLFVALILFISTVILFWKKSTRFRVFIESFILRIPIFGVMFKYYEITQTFRTLGLLLRSNLPLKEAVHNISVGCSGFIYKKEYEKLVESVSRGLPISRFVLAEPKLFPIMVGQMLSVGESSGNLIEVSLYISEYYERELDEIIKKLSSMLEPVLMVVMGVIVGFVAVSVISPIYEITQNIKR